MRCIFLTILISLNSFIYGFTLHYTCSTTENDNWCVKWDFYNLESELKMVRTDYSGERIFLSDARGSIKEVIYKNINEEIYFSGIRDNQNVQIFDKNNNSERIKYINSSHKYWYQPLGLCFFEFVLSNEVRREFFFINPENLKPVFMTIQKKNLEIITIRNENIEAIRAELRLSGVLAPFWKGIYWLCPETGILLRYMGTFGPGTKKTIMELTNVSGIINFF